MDYRDLPNDPPLYAGWFRKTRREPWELVLTDPSEARCLSRLLDARRGGMFIVLPDGQNPNDERALR